MSGNHLDLTHPPEDRGDAAVRLGRCEGRPFLGVHFACCRVYARLYRQPDASGYEGRCPKCGRRVSFRVGAGGTSARFFTAE